MVKLTEVEDRMAAAWLGGEGNGGLRFSEYSFSHATWKRARDLLYNSTQTVLASDTALYT